MQYKESSESQVWVEKLQQIEPIRGSFEAFIQGGCAKHCPIHYTLFVESMAPNITS